MYDIRAFAFLICTIGMTSLLLFLGWQQRQIDAKEIADEKAVKAAAKAERAA